jgi:succinate dehydrogenase / fumarate reductase, cytochrome b subunit
MINLIRYSSLTKKIVMGLAGLFLALFLCVHLCINLTLLLNDKGEFFTKAAGFMSTNVVIKVFEVVLFGGFLIHIIFGLIVTFRNWASRPVGYYKPIAAKTSFFSTYAFYTGALIFMFLVLHFINFYLVKIGWVNGAKFGNGEPDFYTQARHLFHIPLYSVVYIVFFIFLGLHLNHSIQAAFQTLGLNHDKYTPFVKAVSAIYAVVISVGFIIIPVYFLLFFKH